MKVAYFGYRRWAKVIKHNLEMAGYKFTSVSKADVVLYYGWSKMIPDKIYKKKLCFILHPSPLPKYRGGSPIQHQIMAGEKKSAVTICRVTERLDAGDIYSQTPFSLKGTLDEIFERIIKIGTKDTLCMLGLLDYFHNTDWEIIPIKQDESKATYFKRRKPEESELFVGNFFSCTAKELYDFIRSLNDPYPNAFIRCRDGKKLYITGAHL